jgi:hypothetical protein
LEVSDASSVSTIQIAHKRRLRQRYIGVKLYIIPCASLRTGVPKETNKKSLQFSLSGVFFAFAWLASSASAQPTNSALGTVTSLEGPGAGLDSVVLAITPVTGSWTASANTTWLHLSPAFQRGTGSTNVVFSFDANPGATRTGTLTLASQTLTVTQAGSAYVAVSVLANYAGDLDDLAAIAVDPKGDIFLTTRLRTLK